MTSDGAHIREWGEEIGIEFDVPPGAVPQGKKLDLSVWPCCNGPFQLPEGYELASPVFLISPSFQFTFDVTLKKHHYSGFTTKKECESIAFLSSPANLQVPERLMLTLEKGEKPVYKFRVLRNEVYKSFQGFSQISLTHSCLSAIGVKYKKEKSKLIYS